MKHAADSKQITVVARSPFHIYYEGVALAVTATNVVGRFDILPGHADFFSVLSPGEVIVEPLANEDGGTKGREDDLPELITFHITNGIITVRDDNVMLFVNM
jgi:F0F1-type ATP synthase epsilon subunit